MKKLWAKQNTDFIITLFILSSYQLPVTLSLYLFSLVIHALFIILPTEILQQIDEQKV